MTALSISITAKQSIFCSPYPGKIPIDLTEFQGKFICQKSSFLCAAKGVSVGIEFSKKLGRGLLVKVSSCKKLKATDSLLYTQAEPWLKKS
jgi:uncharacterized protein (AIM24 family)